MKNDKKMQSQIVPFIMLVPNCPFYNIGAKLSDAKFSGYQIVQAPDDVDDDHTQGCIFRLTCSYPELTEDYVLTSAYVKFFRTVTRNDVNKSV